VLGVIYALQSKTLDHSGHSIVTLHTANINVNNIVDNHNHLSIYLFILFINTGQAAQLIFPENHNNLHGSNYNS